MAFMKRVASFLAVLLTLWFSASVAWATDYYVSSIRDGRSDANAGTNPDSPWASFDKVASSWGSAIGPGDTVHLERGSTWTFDGWQIDSGGSAGNPITIRGDDYGSGASPVINRHSGSTSGDFCTISHGSYITFQDFVVDGGSQQGYDTSGVVIGSSGQSADIEHIQVLRLTLRNLAAHSSSYVCGIWLAYSNGHAISNCLIEGNDLSGYNAHGINHYGSKSTTPQDSSAHNNTYRDNYLHDMADPYGNVGGGIHIAFGGSGNLFEYNLIEGAHTAGSIFLMNAANDESELVIRYNVVLNNSAESGITVAADGAGADCTFDGEIYGNIIIGSQRAGIWVWPRGFYTGSLDIYNNTLYNNNGIGTQEWWSGGEILVDESASDLDLTIANNILVAAQPNTAGLRIKAGHSGTLDHSHNLYWNAEGSAAPGVDDHGTAYSVADVLGFEPTAQNSDPLFANLAELPTAVSSSTGVSPDGLYPTATSPAIDQGTDLGAGFAADIEGVARPQGAAWDIGAYEYCEGGCAGAGGGGGQGGVAGSGGSGTAGSGGSGGSAGAPALGADSGADGGCGCRAAPSTGAAYPAILALLAGLASIRRRRALDPDGQGVARHEQQGAAAVV
jgi:MYXO-CTERM domain-containing protein